MKTFSTSRLKNSVSLRWRPRQGLEGCEAATARSAGAGAIAESRKARFFYEVKKGAQIPNGFLNSLFDFFDLAVKKFRGAGRGG
jgi:hypothetical protein